MARYHAQLTDHNKTISCTVKQEEYGRTHFTRTFVFRLKIQSRAAFAQRDGLSARKISFLSGVIIGIIFLLLLCVLLSILLLRQNKNNKKRKSEEHELDLMLDTSQSTPLVIKRETLGRDCESGETPRWASQKYNESSFCSPPSNIQKFLADYASPPSDRVTYSHLPSDHISPPSYKLIQMPNHPSAMTDPLLSDQFKNFTSPSLRSLSASQLSSMESFIDLTGQAEAFNLVEEFDYEETKPAKDKNKPKSNTYQDDPVVGSVPNIHQRRRSSGVALTFPSEPRPPPPRPPRSSKSLGHIPRTVEQETQRKRRRTAPSTSKSTHSLFECSEGCFDMESKKSQAQFVTITTGPMVI